MSAKDEKFCFLDKTFLFADISIDIDFGIPFLILSNVKVKFNNQKLRWRSYIAAETLPSMKWVEFVGIKKFAEVAMV